MQTAVKKYKPELFTSLPIVEHAHYAFREANPNLSLFADLFRKHDVNKIAALTLLHKHFDLDADEKLVEMWNEKSKQIEVRPNRSKTNKIAYMWRVCTKNTVSSYHPIEFYDETTPVATEALSITQKLLANQAFLDEFAELLTQTNTSNIFGLCLLHRDDMLMDVDYVHFEETDKPNRVSYMSVHKKNDIDTETSVQTHWRFGPAGGPDEIVVCSQCDLGIGTDAC